MTGFDTVLVVDWSAARRAPARPSRDAIWLGLAQAGVASEPVYCRTRSEAEAHLARIIATERDAGRRLLVGFDFPFGYPRGLARAVTGSDDPLDLWHWLEERIADAPDGSNNRFDVAQEMNARFEGPGPFWGKPHRDRWPGVPYAKRGIVYDRVAERRHCDLVARAASSCFQLAFPPTVGSQVLMGLPTLARLRRLDGVAVWPFEDCTGAPVVLAEIWPGLIEPAVRREMAQAGDEAIRDAVQVRLLARALSRMPAAELRDLMTALPEEAREEAWILGAEHRDRLTDLAGDAADLPPPPLRNDCFALPAGVHWTPVDEALAVLRARLSPVTGVETVPLSDAAGRVLAASVQAVRANPPHPNAAVDGYGFAGAVPEGAHRMPLMPGRAAAGAVFGGEVPEGHALRVLTGAALPRGVDTVILQEDVIAGDDRIAFNGPLKRGANTRRMGEDVEAGAAILAPGRLLTPADMALLAITGHDRVSVRRALRVAVLSTGDELAEAGETPAPGQIHDANRPLLLAMLARWNMVPVDMGRCPDDRNALAARLDAAAGRADVILTSGGASAGDEDHVSALLREAGAMRQWRIAVKPGRPLALGLWQGKPVFGLPGNPVAAMVCTLVFARPALGLLAGMDWTKPQGFDVPAAFEKRKKPGRREYLRARMRDGRAEVFASEGSGRISGLSWAEGLVELDDGACHVRPGDPVRYIPFGSYGL